MVHSFSKGISLNVNVITRVRFELTYFEAQVQHFNHYANGLPNIVQKLALRTFPTKERINEMRNINKNYLTGNRISKKPSLLRKQQDQKMDNVKLLELHRKCFWGDKKLTYTYSLALEILRLEKKNKRILGVVPDIERQDAGLLESM